MRGFVPLLIRCWPARWHSIASSAARLFAPGVRRAGQFGSVEIILVALIIVVLFFWQRSAAIRAKDKKKKKPTLGIEFLPESALPLRASACWA